MCELCVLREETEKLMHEQQFRYHQYQVEINADRPDAARQCEERIQYIQETVLSNFRKKRSIEIQHETIGSVVASGHMN